MTDTQENLVFGTDQVQEVPKAKDVDQTLILSETRLKEAEQDKNNLTPSIIKGDFTRIKGVGPSASKKINDSGIDSMEKLALSTPVQLSHIKGIGPATANRIIEEAISLVSTSNLDKYSSIKEPQPNHTQSTFNTEDVLIEEGSTPLEGETDILFDNNLDDTQTEEWKTPLEGKENLLSGLGNEEFEDITDDIEYENIQELEDNIGKPETTPVMREVKLEVSIPKVSEALEEKELPTIQKSVEISEVLNSEEVENLSDNIIEELQSNDFVILNRTQQLNDIYSKVNILALKTIPINKYLETICIVPVKLCPIKGSLIVSENKIDYNSVNKGLKKKNYENLQHYAQVLTHTYEKLIEDITNEGNFLSFVKKYFKLDLSLEKTITHKTLYFHSGPKQFNFVIEPLIVTKNRVGFTEKSIQFAYQQNSNIHVVDVSGLSCLLSYLEKKVALVEIHTEQTNSIDRRENIIFSFSKNFRITSFLLLIPSCVVFSILLFQGYSFLQLFLNFFFGAYFLYSIIFGCLFTSHYMKIGKIHQDFSTPYHKKKLQVDDTDLILIKEQLSSNLMEQFTYECLEKDNKSKIIEQIEQENVQNYLHEKKIEKKVEKAKLFEENIEHDDSIEENIDETSSSENPTEKYSDFLED